MHAFIHLVHPLGRNARSGRWVVTARGRDTRTDAERGRERKRERDDDDDAREIVETWRRERERERETRVAFGARASERRVSVDVTRT